MMDDWRLLIEQRNKLILVTIDLKPIINQQ